MAMAMTPQDLSAQDKVNQEWNGMAGEWDDMAQPYAKGLNSVLWKRTGIQDPSTCTVLDFGCGTGLLTEELKGQVKRVVAIDAAPKMVEMLQDKIRSRDGFNNVQAYSGILANLENEPTEFRQAVESLKGSVDLIICGSVLNFIPEDDLEATCRVFGWLLKPGKGMLFHTDWPSGEGEPADGMQQEKAQKIYGMAGLVAETMEVGKLQMGKDEADVFFGLAKFAQG